MISISEACATLTVYNEILSDKTSDPRRLEVNSNRFLDRHQLFKYLHRFFKCLKGFQYPNLPMTHSRLITLGQTISHNEFYWIHLRQAWNSIVWEQYSYYFSLHFLTFCSLLWPWPSISCVPWLSKLYILNSY